MKTQELIEALEAYPADSEASLTYWNGQGIEVAPVLMVCDNTDAPSIYAEEWDGPRPGAGLTGSANTPYTPQQVIHNLQEMLANLRPFAANLEGGPGWVVNQCHSILKRGIVGDAIHPIQATE
jgi:hypothetical protein